jgi:hypothetical protein
MYGDSQTMYSKSKFNTSTALPLGPFAFRQPYLVTSRMLAGASEPERIHYAADIVTGQATLAPSTQRLVAAACRIEVRHLRSELDRRRVPRRPYTKKRAAFGLNQSPDELLDLAVAAEAAARNDNAPTNGAPAYSW